MSDPIREALDKLRSEREAVQRAVADLTVELEKAQTRLGHLDGAIDNMERLLPADEDDLDAPSEDHVADDIEGDDGDSGDSDSAAMLPPSERSIRRKWPSTQMVARLIDDLDRPVHRDEIVHLFDLKYGMPESWNNPRNTLGNALLRAWENELITRVDQDTFAPLDHHGVSAREVRG